MGSGQPFTQEKLPVAGLHLKTFPARFFLNVNSRVVLPTPLPLMAPSELGRGLLGGGGHGRMDTGGEGIPGGMQNTEANPIYSAFSIKFSCSILFEKQVPFFFLC